MRRRVNSKATVEVNKVAKLASFEKIDKKDTQQRNVEISYQYMSKLQRLLICQDYDTRQLEAWERATFLFTDSAQI